MPLFPWCFFSRGRGWYDLLSASTLQGALNTNIPSSFSHYTLKCWEGKWLSLYFPLIAVLGIFVVVFGFPGVVYHLLRKAHENRKKPKKEGEEGEPKAKEDEEQLSVLEEMTDAYTYECYYWECM